MSRDKACALQKKDCAAVSIKLFLRSPIVTWCCAFTIKKAIQPAPPGRSLQAHPPWPTKSLQTWSGNNALHFRVVVCKILLLVKTSTQNFAPGSSVASLQASRPGSTTWAFQVVLDQPAVTLGTPHRPSSIFFDLQPNSIVQQPNWWFFFSPYVSGIAAAGIWPWATLSCR